MNIINLVPKFLGAWIFIALTVSCLGGAKEIAISEIDDHILYQDQFLDTLGNYSSTVIKDYESLREEYPNRAESNYLFGRVSPEKRYSCYRKAIQIDSTFSKAYEGLAMYYLIDKESSEMALNLIARAIELDSSEYSYLETRAIIYVSLYNNSKNYADQYKWAQDAYSDFVIVQQHVIPFVWEDELYQLEELILDLKQTIKETAHIGTWSYSDGIFSFTQKIYSNGTWNTEGMLGYSNGTWDGNATKITFYEGGMIYAEASVNEIGSILSLKTDIGVIKLKKR